MTSCLSLASYLLYFFSQFFATPFADRESAGFSIYRYALSLILLNIYSAFVILDLRLSLLR